MASSETTHDERIHFGPAHGPGRLAVASDEETRRQFYDLKEETRQRLGFDELEHEAFLRMLLDCWTLHLEGADDV